MDDRGELVGADDPRAQAERVFENLRLALAAAGATFADVIKFGVFTTDISILPVVRETRDRYVDTDRPPASTAVERLFLAGDWTDTGLPPTIESAVLSGHRAAEAAK